MEDTAVSNGMTNRKILILYASYGDGHIQASKALLQYFQDQGNNRVQMVDLFAEAHPFLNAITRYTYLKSTTYSPALYGWSYYLTHNMKHDQLITKWMNSLCIPKLKEMIEQDKPDAVINTFPMLAMSELRKQTGLSIPTFTVLTDFVLHSRWIHSETDKYFVATEELKKLMIAKGILDDQIKVSGIPIRKAFQKNFDVSAILKKYKLNPEKKNVLIMAGAYNVQSNFKKVINTLLSVGNLQILMVCGRNKVLQTRMEAYFAHDSRVRIFGFVEQIQELMAASSCIITKAGGITLAEALALQLPIIVFRPVPGQEKENSKFLAGLGALLIASHVNDLKKKIQLLLSESRLINRMKLVMRSLNLSVAAEVVVSDILNEIEKRSGRQRKEIETLI